MLSHEICLLTEYGIVKLGRVGGTQFDNKFWIPVIDKILKNKTIRNLEIFLSFLTFKVRDKRYIVES
jgi:hypothetical protein